MGITYNQADRAWEAIADAMDEYLDAAKSDDPFARPDSWVVGKARDAFIKALTENEDSDD